MASSEAIQKSRETWSGLSDLIINSSMACTCIVFCTCNSFNNYLEACFR